jgi:hypothetical protein
MGFESRIIGISTKLDFRQIKDEILISSFIIYPTFCDFLVGHVGQPWKKHMWLDVVAEVRKAIREHDGYIYIPDLKPKGEVAADVGVTIR